MTVQYYLYTGTGPLTWTKYCLFFDGERLPRQYNANGTLLKRPLRVFRFNDVISDPRFKYMGNYIPDVVIEANTGTFERVPDSRINDQSRLIDTLRGDKSELEDQLHAARAMVNAASIKIKSLEGRLAASRDVVKQLEQSNVDKQNVINAIHDNVKKHGDIKHCVKDILDTRERWSDCRTGTITREQLIDILNDWITLYQAVHVLSHDKDQLVDANCRLKNTESFATKQDTIITNRNKTIKALQNDLALQKMRNVELLALIESLQSEKYNREMSTPIGQEVSELRSEINTLKRDDTQHRATIHTQRERIKEICAANQKYADINSEQGKDIVGLREVIEEYRKYTGMLPYQVKIVNEVKEQKQTPSFGDLYGGPAGKAGDPDSRIKGQNAVFARIYGGNVDCQNIPKNENPCKEVTVGKVYDEASLINAAKAVAVNRFIDFLTKVFKETCNKL